ncbi:hypothetical protein SK571_17040 [Lentzea sp. BCCO 10_0798]|uniref:TetR family transcriptional regulator n=1 Tax=Lentzea kristufekii TaxID=3095430 RepID=A0ABU4TS35_9PSEU|nr:hypothetical protein [Lentzea sp. BCCO 10_0798]MDX8051095.1 hypothetical protein [Lentzea sp. BCCO 10_0798]
MVVGEGRYRLRALRTRTSSTKPIVDDRPDLRGRATMASMLIPALAGLGARDPLAASDTLGACVQGLFLQQFGRGEAIDPRPLVEVIVRGALA